MLWRERLRALLREATPNSRPPHFFFISVAEIAPSSSTLRPLDNYHSFSERSSEVAHHLDFVLVARTIYPHCVAIAAATPS